jgi:hypothetical protein
VPSQTAAPFAGTAHAVHDAGPQFATLVFETQAVPQRWKPALHTEPHEVPLQVAVALAAVGHAVHEDPHVMGLLLAWHALPQT